MPLKVRFLPRQLRYAVIEPDVNRDNLSHCDIMSHLKTFLDKSFLSIHRCSSSVHIPN